MFEIGNKIKFKKEKQRYNVTACNERFVIASKPFNPKKTFQYVIVDLKEKIRGADNYYCKHDYEDLNECDIALSELTEGRLQISWRNRIKLDIEEVYGS